MKNSIGLLNQRADRSPVFAKEGVSRNDDLHDVTPSNWSSISLSDHDEDLGFLDKGHRMPPKLFNLLSGGVPVQKLRRTYNGLPLLLGILP